MSDEVTLLDPCRNGVCLRAAGHEGPCPQGLAESMAHLRELEERHAVAKEGRDPVIGPLRVEALPDGSLRAGFSHGKHEHAVLCPIGMFESEEKARRSLERNYRASVEAIHFGRQVCKGE